MRDYFCGPNEHSYGFLVMRVSNEKRLRTKNKIIGLNSSKKSAKS